MSAAGTNLRGIEALRARYDALGQGHVFAHWDCLDAPSRSAFRSQLEALEPRLEGLLAAWKSATTALGAEPAQAIEPAEVIAHPDHGGDASAFARAEARGTEALRAGRLAAFVVAGGQGTRLGFDGPKGLFPVGPVSGRTLFELQAQKIRGLARRYGSLIPWYVMTSDATDEATRALFDRADCFGLAREDVFIFRQDCVPAFDFSGHMLLEAPDRIFENPNGHGGSLTALDVSGALDDMATRGIDTIFYYQVDNPLIRMCDPTFIGFHLGDAGEPAACVSCKVVRKRDPMEKVGVLARRDGRWAVVEYTELRDQQRYARDEEGNLVYWAGNSAIHLFSTAFVRQMAKRADEWLPYHASAKKVSTINSAGAPVIPAEANAHKLERFVFDALPQAQRACAVEALAADEFSPIKNAEGTESPETARRDLETCCRNWLAKAGTVLPPDDQAIEIDHSCIDGPEDACAAGLARWTDDSHIIRVSTQGNE